MSQTILGDFSDVSSAVIFLKENNPAGNWPYLFCYLLELTPQCRYDYSYPVTIFDRNGNLRGAYDNSQSDCFPGRMESDCRFKIGDIVQFGYHKLVLGVVESSPPDPAFVARVRGQNGMLDAVDDSYLVLCDKEGKDHAHLHECELFEPDAPIPRSITTLQKTVLAGNWRTSLPVKDFYQKSLFLSWLADNKQLFSHEPSLAKEDDISFSVRFNGITGYITCRFTETGDIMIMVDYRNRNYDVVAEFALYEEQTPDGRFLCSQCRDNPSEMNSLKVLKYATRDVLWIKHSFEPLAQWTREIFADDAVLCLFRDNDSTAAHIASGEKLEKMRKRPGFFKEIPVIISRR